MKHDWEYKKWKDVLTIINGKNQKNVECDNGQYPIYGSGGIMGHANDYLCPENTTIIGRKGSINKPLFIATKFWNVDTAFGLVSNSSLLNPKYLFYFCCNYNFETLNKAVTIPSLTKNDLLQIGINVPPLSTQQSIVSELDSLSQIIADCKETLKDYDALEQSIFYDMFGDPVKNEKGWEVKKLGEMCDIITKGTTPTTVGFQFLSEGINFVKVESFEEGKLNATKFAYISKECHEALRRSQLCVNDILICIAGATVGKLAIVTEDILPANTNQACCLIRLKNEYAISRDYIFNVLQSDYIKNFIESLKKGVAQPNLTLEHVRNFNIPNVPLPLQQQFASKIEAIEQMKVETKKALQEAETLFQARMDYWFN